MMPLENLMKQDSVEEAAETHSGDGRGDDQLALVPVDHVALSLPAPATVRLLRVIRLSKS
jgi:hypothetical protein